MRANNIAFLVLLVYGMFTNLFANPPFGNFRSITLTEGLNNNTVYDIAEDSRGFIWLSTDMGISRYDGYHCRNYPFVDKSKSDEKPAYSLPKAISEIKADTDRLLYLRLLQGGITCFDKVEECYLPIRFSRPFEEQKINSLYVADKRVIYLGTAQGLYGAEVKRPDKDVNEFVELKLTDAPLVKGNVSLLCGDNQGNLFFCLDGKTVVCYSMGTRQEKNISLSANRTFPVSKLYVSGDYLWICSKRGEIGCYNYKRDVYRELTDSASVERTRLSDTYITDIVAGNNSDYYLSTGAGLFYLKFESDKLSTAPYTIDFIAQNDNFSIDNKITVLMWGQSQNVLWVGTLGGGFVRIRCDVGENAMKNQKTDGRLILSDLWLGGKSIKVGEKANGHVVLTSAPDCQPRFVFSADDNDFYFYFTDMKYETESTKIAYRLLPNEMWDITTLENGVRFNYLRAGEYTLQVKLVGTNETEGKVVDIPITIERQWWVTPWAITIYVLLFGTFMAGLFYFLLQWAKKKMQYTGRIQEPSTQELVAVPTAQAMRSRGDREVRNIIFTHFMQELRTPLSLIISPLREVMQEKELSKGLSTKILVAYRNSIGMLNSCDQLLGVYTYLPNPDKVELASYNIIKVTDAFVFSLNEFFRIHPIRFQYEKKIRKDAEVWIDKKAIELALQNLLANAFIHVRYSGVVALILQEVIEEGISYCTISVVDNGKSQVKTAEELGEDKEKLATVDTAEVELGFAVMQDIMNCHHGSITLENLRGGGTKVQLKWPIGKSVFEADNKVVFIDSEQQEDVTLLEPASLIDAIEEKEEQLLVEGEVGLAEKARKTILVIEDYTDIRLYLKVFFEKEYDVLLATNGEEGINLARKELPDLIICDIMMPVKDGYECCQELKNGLDTCHIPFVLLTAKVEDDDIIKGLEMGADDYILKPFVPQILKIKVKNLIEGRVSLKKMYTKLLVTPLTDNVSSDAQGEKEEEIEDPFISTVVRIIEENILEPDFSVKKLASDLNMSQPTLYRKVKQCTDFTIIELIRSVRMRRAATLLKKKQYPVQEVAEMVGYNDIPTFRKHFVDTYGVNPSIYADSEVSQKK